MREYIPPLPSEACAFGEEVIWSIIQVEGHVEYQAVTPLPIFYCVTCSVLNRQGGEILIIVCEADALNG